MTTNVQTESQKQRRMLERLLEDTIVDKNIRRYIFGTDDIDELKEDVLSEFRQYPVYIKNILMLTFYFAYACYRYDIDYGEMCSKKMTKHNAQRVIKSLQDAFVRHHVTQDLIQYVLTDIQFELAQSAGELKEVFGDISNRDMSRFSFNPYFKFVAAYDKNPSRYVCEDREASSRMLRELLETLTFLQDYELQQTGADMFRFVCKNGAYCEFDTLQLNHVFFQNEKGLGGIFSLFSAEIRNNKIAPGKDTQTIILRYFSDKKSLTFSIPEDANNKSSHLADQRSNEIYMELTGSEMTVESSVDRLSKTSNSIDQIHAVNYKYIKNLALSISDAVSANAGSKDALYKHFARAYPYIFQKNGNADQRGKNVDFNSLDWDTVVIMLLIEASPTTVLERLMYSVPQTFYDIVVNLYNRTNLEFFKSKQSELNAEIQRIYDTKLVVGEAGGFGKITMPKPTGRMLARARAMLIMSHLSMLQESDQEDNKLIYTGNLISNISLLKNTSGTEEKERKIRYACIILGETLRHLMCFYHGLFNYGEGKSEYDSMTRDKCLSKDKIKEEQKKLEGMFFSAAKAKAKELSEQEYCLDQPKDTLRLFAKFIEFCDSTKNNNMPNMRKLYSAVGKYEIIDKRVLQKQYAQLEAVSDDPYKHADIWGNVTLEILEYFKTGSYSDTSYDHDLLNTIYPFTAAFNRKKENPDGYETVNFSLNIDIDNDNNMEYQTDVNVLSEFSYDRNKVYYCLPNVIRSNYKWWIDPILINFKEFNDIFSHGRKEDV